MTERADVKQEDRWNIAATYASIKEWQIDFNSVKPEIDPPYWPEIEKYRNHLDSNLKEAITIILDLQRKIEKLYTYSHLRNDEDISNNEYKNIHNQSFNLYTTFVQAIAWFEPEVLSLEEETLNKLLEDSSMHQYKFYIEKIYRLKKHSLPQEHELLIAMSNNATSSYQKAFSAINDADFDFGTAKNSSDEDVALTHASYSLYLRSDDRVLRKNSFEKMHLKYKQYQNSMAELLQGQVHTHIFNARAHKYTSSLEASLYPQNIDADVYHNLIKTVENRLPSLHKYIELRKRLLGLDEIHLYDMYAPLTNNADIKFSYEEARQNVIDSTEILGEEYQHTISEGLTRQGWVDKFENKNKRSGAYSSGCYDTMPYILMNFNGTLNDVFTLAHEAGHSMHSYLTRAKQPYQYGDYTIFVAEVASTFNEDLLFHHLHDKCINKEEKKQLIIQKLDNIRATLFRQTMFAKFELWIHDQVEQGQFLTPQKLNEYFYTLNKKYFGEDSVVDKEISVEWARIPHFYYNFYVYQYATGISAALALSEKVRNGTPDDLTRYLNFLKSGSSKYPLKLLEDAGVSMYSSQPIDTAINCFDRLCSELQLIST